VQQYTTGCGFVNEMGAEFVLAGLA